MYTKIKIDNKDYELKLTTRASVELEEELGFNPLKIFASEFPKMKHMILMIKHSIDYEGDIYELIDKWFSEGHSVNELVALCLNILKSSGYITLSNDSKN